MRTLQDVLEEIKQNNAYGVSLSYGEEVGCDDMDVPQNEREVVILWYPTGVIGQAKIVLKDTLENILKKDISSLKPTVISNPPNRKEWEKPGCYIWGTSEAIKTLTEKK